jgi:RNase P subunit RPR2
MYCVKCRTKREGKNVQEVTMKNGKKALKAECEVCGTKMFKIKGNA